MDRVRSAVGIAAVVCVVVACAGDLGAADPPLPEPGLYGLYSWAANYVKYADDVDQVGIRWVRCGGWHQTDAADRAALEAARRGVHLTPSLGLRGLSHGRTMPVDQAVAAYRKMCRQAVERYGPGGSLWRENGDVKPLPIRYWQVWNEPNIEFLNPGESGLLRTELYAKLLAAASQEIRKADPGAQIIAFNTAGGVPYGGKGVPPDGMWQKLKYIGWRKFIRDVAKATGPEAFDAVGTHPYTKPKGPETRVDKGVEMLREVFAEQGWTKPVWFTEVGYPLDYPRNQQVRDEREQACFTARLYAIAAAHGVAQVQVMYIEDITYGPDNSRRTFGFFTAPGKWREQARATQVMTRLIPDPRKNVRILKEEPGGVWAYEFAGAGGIPVTMAWNSGEGEAELKLEVEAKSWYAVDLLGNVRLLDADEDGGATVLLTESPVYVLVGLNDVPDLNRPLDDALGALREADWPGAKKEKRDE